MLSDSPSKIQLFEKDNQQSNNSDSNKVSNLLLENRNLMKKLLELDEIIKKQKIENEENHRVISDLFEIKYKFEEIEMNNISKIEFLERKIKKLTSKILTVKKNKDVELVYSEEQNCSICYEQIEKNEN